VFLILIRILRPDCFEKWRNSLKTVQGRLVNDHTCDSDLRLFKTMTVEKTKSATLCNILNAGSGPSRYHGTQCGYCGARAVLAKRDSAARIFVDSIERLGKHSRIRAHTWPNAGNVVMRKCYANSGSASCNHGSDPNGIRNRFSHFVKLRSYRLNAQDSAR
jgi:hypothetical protein